MKLAVVSATIVVGFLLLICSSLWTSLFPATSTWTNEKATRATEVKARLSNLGPLIHDSTRYMHRGSDPATLLTEFEALKKEDAQLNEEFENAAIRPHTIATLLKWTGITLAGLGILGWFAVRES